MSVSFTVGSISYDFVPTGEGPSVLPIPYMYRERWQRTPALLVYTSQNIYVAYTKNPVYFHK